MMSLSVGQERDRGPVSRRKERSIRDKEEDRQLGLCTQLRHSGSSPVGKEKSARTSEDSHDQNGISE